MNASPIDGICCANDYVALNIMRGLADFGLRAPADVRIIGFDGIAEGAYASRAIVGHRLIARESTGLSHH